MFSGLSRMNTIPLIDTSKGTTFTSMFSNCPALKTIPFLNSSSGSGFNTMFSNDFSLTSIPLLNTSASTSFTNTFNNCFSLVSGSLTGSKVNISYNRCKLARSAIVSIFNNLSPVTSGSRTITVTNNPGSNDLTAGDLAIANGKGWVVAK
jgi:hypothetical protein